MVSASVGAFAATKLTLTINGKVVKTDIREINGTLYAPIKTITDSIGGYDYKYDKKTGAIDVAPKATPKSTVGLARSNPAPHKTTVTVAVDDILNKFSASVSVGEIIRGEDAWQLVQEANQFNKEPANGYEYLLAKITIKIIKTEKADSQIDISGYSFKLVSSAGKDYESSFAVDPEPSLNSRLYAGASNTGWAVFTVKKEDASPLLTFGRKYDGTGGAWFKVK